MLHRKEGNWKGGNEWFGKSGGWPTLLNRSAIFPGGIRLSPLEMTSFACCYLEVGTLDAGLCPTNRIMDGFKSDSLVTPMSLMSVSISDRMT